MSSLVITLQSPALPEPVDLELPGNVPVGRLLPELVRALGLPPDEYQLLCHSRRLSDDEALFAAQVVTGNTLTLLPVPQEAGAQAAEEVSVVKVERGAAPGRRQPGAGTPRDIHLADLVPSRVGRRPRGRTGRVAAFWSGPAGGTGRTVLAMATGILAAERGEDAVLLALSEPAVSAYLHVPRMPNATTFFETGNLRRAEQKVGWEGGKGRTGLHVILGPARPRDGVVEREDIGALIQAARAAHSLVLCDLPALPPGGNAWVLEPLVQAASLVLVMVPTVAGVTATVAALTTLRDLRAPALSNSEGTGQVHLVLNRRSAGGPSARAFADGVAELWGACPRVAVELGALPDLPALLDRGELPEAVLGSSPLARAVGALLGLLVDY